MGETNEEVIEQKFIFNNQKHGTLILEERRWMILITFSLYS